MRQRDFEEAIKTYIRQSGRSQAAMARLLNVASDTFNKWVRGINRMPIDILHAFCELVQLDENQRTDLFKLAGHVVPPVMEEQNIVSSTSTETTGPPLPLAPLPEKSYLELIGRETVVADMLAALREPTGKRLLAVDGMGGIGKTALARELVDRCLAEQSFDVTVWVQAPKEEFVDLKRRKKTGTLTFESTLDEIARHLGAVDVVKLRGTAKEARVRALLQMQRVLIVLDNLETAKDPQNEIAHRLLSCLGTSKAILTSRQRFQGDVYAIHLDGLAEEDCIRFIHQEADQKNIKRVATAGVNKLKQIANDTGGSPLALKLVIGQLESLDLDIVLTLLKDVRIPDQASQEDEYFRFYQGIFFSSWKLLSDKSQELLISMAHFAPGKGGTVEAIQATSDLEDLTLTHCIRELWRFSFLEVGESPGLKKLRYYLHALTQYFVLADIVKVI